MGIEMKPYYRPLSLESFAYLLKKAGEKAKVLAGGSYFLNGAEAKKGEVLIDLQALKLDQVRYEGEIMHVGGLCNLNMLMMAASGLPDLCEAIRHESGSNVRNTLSVANFLCSGRVGQSSPLLCALMALDAKLLPILESKPVSLSDLYERELPIPVAAELTLPRNVDFRFAQVGRSEMDLPQVSMGITIKNNKQLRVAMDIGRLLFVEGTREEVVQFIQDKCSQMGDQWAGAEYRKKTLMVLLDRILAERQLRKEMK
ncbi:MAG TPA: FAD binding domain-containing protein [Anaerolineaceae bacterium]|nr:FAD binding domain-containing protein [Anaerolineaceae bacterium]